MAPAATTSPPTSPPKKPTSSSTAAPPPGAPNAPLFIAQRGHRVDAGGEARVDERGKEGDDEQVRGFAEDHLQNLGAAGAHRQPDTDFAAALGDKVGDDSITAVSAPRTFPSACATLSS